MITAMDRLGEGRTLVVGDRLDTDIAAAAAAHLDAAVVLTGHTTAEEAEEAKRRPKDQPRPIAVAESLFALAVDERPRQQ
jgi:ribonucleotide monophosphatase NagD (HAD superfamily)